MKLFKSLKERLKLPHFDRAKMPFIGVILVAFLAIFAINTTPVMTTNVYAEPAEAVSAADETCYTQVGALGWFICPGTGVLAKAIDAVYGIIKELLTVQPLFNNDTSPIFQVWQIMRDITNIVFVIMLLIIIYSQVTGIGIANYGIKKALPKLIISAVLVNLSFLICALAVDSSNVIGASLREVFEGIEVNAINSGGLGTAAQVTWTDLASALVGGGTVAGVAIGVAGGLGAFLWPVLAAMICGVLSVLVGLITIGLRQALVAMLVMIAPLAFVAYLLPNTEQYFKKWKDTLIAMLIFYPMFSLLFGASQLAGWAIIASSGNAGNLGPFFIVLGMAVQVFPLFLSVSLLKMSNTILGTVSSKLDNLFNKPKEGIRAFADQNRQLAMNRHVNNSALPSAHLRRFLDGQKRKLDIGAENAEKIRRGNAEIWAQRRIANMMKYDPADSEKYTKGEKQADGKVKQYYLKADAFTRDAKMAGNIEMDVKTAQDDAKHLIANSYGEYYGKTHQDKALADHGAKSFKEMNRATFTTVNDDEADFNYLTSEYLKAANAGHDSYQYKHFVESAGGSLGELGSTSVLGQLIAKAAANEARHRHDFGILGAKFNIDKRAFRNMVTGYYVNDDGLATYAPDADGNQSKAYYINDKNERVYEQYPGEFLKYHPEALHPYQLRDENGAYFVMKDLNGNFVTRIYKHNTPVMKEIFQNFDTIIQDPIDGLYGMLAGIKEGTYTEVKDENGNVIARLPDVGFSNLRTTVGRSIQGANFKEKAAFAGPMYTTAVARGYIKNFTDNNIHRLDGIIKAVKAGNFNIQDKFELELLADLMNPENFVNGRLEYLFPYEDLKTAFDVNGKQLRGTKINEDGSTSDVEPEKATYEQLLNTVKKKYLFPASQAIAYMMSRATTPNVADAQKSGSAEAWGLLANSIDKWTDPKLAKDAHLPNPYKRSSNTVDTAYEMQKKIRESSTPTKAKSAYSNNNPASSDDIIRNHQKNIPEPNPIDQYNQALSGKANAMRSQIEMFKSAYLYDPGAFSQAVLTLIGEDPEFEDVYFEFSNYVDDIPTATTEQLYQAIIESLYRFDI